MATVSDNQYPKLILTPTDPATLTVPSGDQALVLDSTNSDVLSLVDDAGAATPVDSGGGGGGTFTGVKATRSAAYSLASATGTAFPFDAEDWDTDSFHSTSTNTSRLTVPAGLGGHYLAVGCFACSDAISATTFSASIRVNGAAVHGGQTVASLTASTAAANVSVELNLAAGDYVELWYFQNSGAVRNAGVSACSLSLRKVD